MINIAAVIQDLTNLKTGWKTSEFWVALVPAFAAVLHVLGVDISSNATDQIIIIAWGAVSAVYVAARTWLKAVHVGHAVSLAGLLHQIEQEAANVVSGKAVTLPIDTQVIPATSASQSPAPTA